MVTCERCHRKFPSYRALKNHYADRHGNISWSTELETRRVAEGELESQTARWHPKRSHSGLMIALLLIVILGGAAAYFVFNSGSGSSYTYTGSDPTLQICMGDSTAIVEHIHPHLTIITGGSELTIPTNIGITPACMSPVHTHDSSGEIHVESPVKYPYTIHDFFLVWNQPFDSNHLLQYSVDSTHTLTMTVNGAPNNQFQNYVMQDGDQIVITYDYST